MVAFVLDAVSVLLTAVAALLSIRQVVAHSKLMRRHNELLTDRAVELEQFAGRVAHDIRSPIAAATASFALVQRQPGISAKVEEVSARGLSSLLRATRFVEGLLEFARAGAHPVEGARAQVRAVLDELVADLRPAAEEARVEIVIDRLDDEAVRCESSILEVIVANLLRNAIKYMGASEERKIVVRAIARAEAVRVEIEDTGAGVPAPLRRSIFEPFVRGPSHGQAGVGLGLATVKRICEAHGGSVDVEPRSGGSGSVFWFELPRVI
jgi:signal transduction histidine kinase